MERNSTIVIDETVLASKGQRFANYIVDTVIYYSLVYLIGALAGWLYAAFGYTGMYNWVIGMGTFEGLLFNFVVMALYFLFMEGFTQKTIGKLITGTIVIMDDGSKPAAGTVALRTLCRFIPFEAFSFFNDSARGWHDSMTDTYVVNVKKYKEALELKSSFDEIGTEQV
jgi:uncharacterized RDD family membrane protein YckC